MASSKTFLERTAQNRILQHILFWVLSYFVLYRLFSYSQELNKADFIYTLLFHLGLVAGVYLNLLFLIPNLLSRKKYLAYFGAFAGLLLGCAWFISFTFNHLCDFLFPGFYFISDYEYWELLQFVLIYLVLSTLFKLSKAWFQILENQKKIHLLEKEKLKVELTALKTQINPHFLFNNLNSLYSLSLDADEKTPELILKLSETMRYMLYESNENFVPLQKELEFLHNYIELQRLRSQEKYRISFQTIGEIKDQKVAPLLFIPFVENGFKHGIKGDVDSAFLNILLKIRDQDLTFKVENNKGTVDQIQNDNSNGIGLKNVQRRLELLYQDKYELNIVDGINNFSVELRLVLN
ncbi:MAG: histidine kinase [Bacteroidetes bacterium]|nr:histidine kinase [Bacteroidota bacterium]